MFVSSQVRLDVGTPRFLRTQPERNSQGKKMLDHDKTMSPEARAIPWESVVLTLSCPPKLQLGAFVVVVVVCCMLFPLGMPRNNPKSVSDMYNWCGIISVYTNGIPSGDGTKGLHSQDTHTTPWSWLDPDDNKSPAQVALSKTAHSLKLRWSADSVPTSNLDRSSVKFLLYCMLGMQSGRPSCARVPAQGQ